jgi:hypothetical protein
MLKEGDIVYLQSELVRANYDFSVIDYYVIDSFINNDAFLKKILPIKTNHIVTSDSKRRMRLGNVKGRRKNYIN